MARKTCLKLAKIILAQQAEIEKVIDKGLNKDHSVTLVRMLNFEHKVVSVYLLYYGDDDDHYYFYHYLC